jgi:cytochrome b involved in lipid metabolism
MKATKIFGDIKKFLHPGGEKKQTMLQYIDDTKISIKGEGENISNTFNLLQLYLINELKIHLEKIVTYSCY